MLDAIESAADEQVAAVIEVIASADPDVLILQSIDWDHGLATLSALADALAEAGASYPHRFALRPNTGMATGLDLDGDGKLGGPGDAQGYGAFAGAGGMAILSRLPVAEPEVRDLSGLLWREFPGALLEPDTLAPDAREILRLSTTGHWIVPLVTPQGGRLSVLTWHATAPVFDGPEDRNGRRNHDETALWLQVLDGAIGPAPHRPLVVAGVANLDPAAEDGRPDALRALLARGDLTDPSPASTGAPLAAGNASGPGAPDALDTADWNDGPDRAGNRRVSYLLPSSDLAVLGAGVVWPEPTNSFAETVARASRHRLVWIDVDLPAAAAGH